VQGAAGRPASDRGGRPRILVVEDDPSISLGLRMNLEAEGYDVTVAEDGEVGLTRARERWDLIVLDVMLPRVNGFEIVKAIRGAGVGTPIIMLSARNAEMDKVLGLELGAEDYVTKPFSLAELLARVRVALRRGAAAGALGGAAPVRRGGLRFADVEIDVDTREVRRAGALVEMTAKEFDILVTLYEAAGRVLSRQQLFDAVWGPNHHGTPRTIDNFVAQLRTKLEADPAAPRHLVTVRGVGYRLVR
jgi:DNA-binding response OmpR family regulator